MAPSSRSYSRSTSGSSSSSKSSGSHTPSSSSKKSNHSNHSPPTATKASDIPPAAEKQRSPKEGRASLPKEPAGSDRGKRASSPQPLIREQKVKRKPMKDKESSPSIPPRLYVGHLTRNVTEGHLREIFSTWGRVRQVDVSMDKVVNLPRGYAYVEFERREDAEKALMYMDGGQIDGNNIQVKFVHLPRKKAPSPIQSRQQRSPHRDVPPPQYRDGDHHRDMMERRSPRRRTPPRHRHRSPPGARRRSRSPMYRRRSKSPRRRSPPPRHGSPRRYPPMPRRRSPPRRIARPRGPPTPARRRRSPSPPRMRRRSPAPRPQWRRPSSRGRSPPRNRRPIHRHRSSSSRSSYSSTSRSRSSSGRSSSTSSQSSCKPGSVTKS